MRRRYTGLYCAWCDAPVPNSEGLPPLPEFDVIVAYCSEECEDVARFAAFVRRVAAATFDELGELQAGYPEYCARLLVLGGQVADHVAGDAAPRVVSLGAAAPRS